MRQTFIALRDSTLFSLAFATGVGIGAGKLPNWTALVIGFVCGVLACYWPTKERP